VRAGKVKVEGWLEDSGLDALTVARRFEDAGVATLIVTDIDRDGALVGANVEVFGQVADAVSIPVIAAGGLATTDDIVRLRQRSGTPISGAVLGRSLYAGTIRPAEALTAASRKVPA
jgi:phosphoribosylformimino-5-aminoimidazole carboxamide ribotide isomerase